MDDDTTVAGLEDPGGRLDRNNQGLPYLIIMAGPAIGERFPLKSPHQIIGRNSDVEMSVNDTQISRQHADVMVDDVGVLIRDMGSRNGVFCNNQRITEQRLKDGDLIRVGKTTLKYVGPNSLEYGYLKDMSDRARRDTLTGLFNKQAFSTYLEQNLVRCKALHEPLSVAMMDLDFFKKINDGWGHPAGDYVLREFADIVKGKIRPADLLARYGGEEFAMVFPHTHLLEGRVVGERVRTTVGNHDFVFEGHKLSVTVSVGIAEMDNENKEMDRLIARADEALYKAKKDGRNRVYCFDG